MRNDSRVVSLSFLILILTYVTPNRWILYNLDNTCRYDFVYGAMCLMATTFVQLVLLTENRLNILSL
jgi:hypothetical protein